MIWGKGMSNTQRNGEHDGGERRNSGDVFLRMIEFWLQFCRVGQEQTILPFPG
uniref:Uncharacterized protein n=1 Tax=Candidatus Kentrum sp. DK TaxID=2126562 RepID=A0A450SXV5_9GAMM|nr:MAG: hypothetical protein BECKDK2373B_GA0170837_10783 [Candidatus Kentron sp. DK]